MRILSTPEERRSASRPAFFCPEPMCFKGLASKAATGAVFGRGFKLGLPRGGILAFVAGVSGKGGTPMGVWVERNAVPPATLSRSLMEAAFFHGCPSTTMHVASARMGWPEFGRRRCVAKAHRAPA